MFTFAQSPRKAFTVVLFSLVILTESAICNDVRQVLNINPAWKFTLGNTDANAIEQPAGKGFELVEFNDSSWSDVALPHTLKEATLGLDDSMDNKLQHTFHRYVGFYRKTLDLGRKDEAKNYFLHFQGAMQTTELWVNGHRIGKYEVSGYDSFHFDVTSAWKSGENVIAVKVDNRINETTPPDGKKMSKDFVLFGGIYRDVELVTTGKLYVNFPWEAQQAGVRITFPKVDKAGSDIKLTTTLKNDHAKGVRGEVITVIEDAAGKVVARAKARLNLLAGKTGTITQDFRGVPVKLWHPDSPALYTAKSKVLVNGKTMDLVKTRFGVRSLLFTEDKGFFINGEHLKLQGSNRHQSWPFIGNAVPNSLHRRDAEIIKAAGMNWVRLSHYPHDPDFLAACDELGLLLLEEGPTWMRSNGETWMENLLASVRSMIRRDRNHPSIMTWNACINHSGYSKRIGEVCMEEDSRPVGAKLPRTPMDFSHKRISGKGALTIEHTGHTYPRGRGEIRLGGVDADFELARRHWEHISASFAKPENAGMAVWCMFDYSTFHNVDEKGIVWHGVNDLTRLPKHSYAWHQSEFTEKPMIYIVHYAPGKVCVFSNCETVKLWQAKDGKPELVVGRRIKDLALKNPPIEFNVKQGVEQLKAQGFKNGRPVASTLWRKPGLPAAIQLEVDSKQIIADGSDLTRLVATAVDDKGTPLRHLAAHAVFSVNGKGSIVGENPAPFRAGKAVVLLRGHYSPGELNVEVSSPGLKADSVSINCIAPSSAVHLPKTLPEFHPRSVHASDGFAYLSDLSWSFQQSQGQRWNRRFGLSGYRELESNGQTYSHVIDVKAPAQVIYNLGGLYRKFTATLAAMKGKVEYRILLDGKPVMVKKNLTEDTQIEVSLQGVQTLCLLNTTEPKGAKARALWADAKLFHGRSAKLASRDIIDASLFPNLKTLTGHVSEKQEGMPVPVVFNTVNNAVSGEWVESNIAMISGGDSSYPISIKNGEYRIYSRPWTSKAGTIRPGDALTVRVRAGESGAKAEIQIGRGTTHFKAIVESRLSQFSESVTANSEHDQGSRAQLALDGDALTFWHSKWGAGETPHPHHLTVKLKSSMTVKGITVLPRQDISNGRIGKYRIVTSSDGKNWNSAAAGTWANDAGLKKVLFKRPVKLRYLRVEALSEVNGRSWSSIAELNLISNK